MFFLKLTINFKLIALESKIVENAWGGAAPVKSLKRGPRLVCLPFQCWSHKASDNMSPG